MLKPSRMIPVGAYALLLNKTEATYDEFLQQIQVLTNNSDPLSIMTDFELAAINSVNTTYPNSDPSGCLFHLSKNIYNRVQEEGIHVPYNNNVNDLQTNLRMLAALAFVPENDVEQSFNMLRSN